MNVAWYFKSGNTDDKTVLARMANGAVIHIVNGDEIDEAKPMITLGAAGWRSAVSQAKAMGAVIPDAD